MKIKTSMGRVLAAALVLCLSALPAAAQTQEAEHTHTWRTDWAIDDYHHWHGCVDPSCRTLVPSQASGYGYHSYDGVHDSVCNVCHWVRAADPGHDHIWGTEWDADSSHHWFRCTDDACSGVVPAWAKGYGGHIYDSSEDLDCNVCGWNRFTIPDHTHTWSSHWGGDGKDHWYQCTDPYCPGVVPSQAPGYGGHVYDSITDPDCNTCGKNRFVDPYHTHTWGLDWSSDGIYHWYQCTDPYCPGVVPSQAAGYGSHVYDGPQDIDCNICSKTRFVDPYHVHTWGTAWSSNEAFHWYQCTGAGCPGVVPSQAPGYTAHVYDNSLDPDCNVCGTTRIVFPTTSGILPAPTDNSNIVKRGRGWVSVQPSSPQEGRKVTVVLVPEPGYTASSLTVTDQEGQPVATNRLGSGTWSFLHPKDPVTFYAVFLPSFQTCTRGTDCPAAAFNDLSPAQWYHDGIHYCLDWGLMSGYDSSCFAPDARLSGGMMAQILYNLTGRPDVLASSVYQGTGAWYDTAVAWATGAGVMYMDNVTLFSPREDVTREQLAVMLWRYAGRPEASGQTLQFSDAASVSGWATEAVRWAAGREILQGRGGARLDPGGKITRAEAASMLVRFLDGSNL